MFTQIQLLGFFDLFFFAIYSIMNEHASISYVNGIVEIRPAEKGAKIKINGQPVTGTQTLTNKDRVMFGMQLINNILIINLTILYFVVR